jgi:D-beta-D-heptose 7-phosphate kinase/D-beta-D-heptose 1-phosphate adenosyltransferase
MIIGLCNGCFDDLHEGHLYFLQEAKRKCDYLILAINHDMSVALLKGDGRPIYPLAQRIEALNARASAWVDAIIPFAGNPIIIIDQIMPTLIIRGEDQSDEGHTRRPIVRVARIPGISTTENQRAKVRLS